MPGPVTLLSTIGAVGAAGAAVYVTKVHSLQDAQQVYTSTWVCYIITNAQIINLRTLQETMGIMSK